MTRRDAGSSPKHCDQPLKMLHCSPEQQSLLVLQPAVEYKHKHEPMLDVGSVVGTTVKLLDDTQGKRHVLSAPHTAAGLQQPPFI